MNDISYSALRKKISIHAMILAVILIIGLGDYIIGAAIGGLGDNYAAFIFPVFIWGKVAIIDGLTYVIFSSIALLLAFPVLLFIWGRGYRQKQHFALRLQICYGLFLSLLGYCWLRSAFLHIAVLSIPKRVTPYPDGAFPAPAGALGDRMLTNFNEPPLHSWIFVVYVIVLAAYTIEVSWTLRLLKRAEKLRKAH